MKKLFALLMMLVVCSGCVMQYDDDYWRSPAGQREWARDKYHERSPEKESQ